MTLDQVVSSIPSRLGRKMLTFDEVMASKRPAVYEEYGDLLVYLHETVFVVQGSGAHADAMPTAIDPRSLGSAIGIETGWRHAEGCDCHVCGEGGRVRAA
jgi:hypothetical protein